MLPYDFSLIFFIFVVQAAGYLIKGLVGFGNPVLTAPLLSLALDNSVISPSGLLIDGPTNAWISWRNRRSIEWKMILPLTASCLLGVIPGTMLLKLSLPWVIKAILGVFVTAIGIEMATRGQRKAAVGRPGFQYVVAFISGIFAGLYGINLLIVAYLERTSRDHSAFKGSMCILFLAENIFRLVMYLVTGIFTVESLWVTLFTIPGAVLGLWIGTRLESRISEKNANRAVILLFLLSGISILCKSLLFHS